MSIEEELLGDINSFLSSNSVDQETLSFLISLKQKILEGYDMTTKQNKISDIETTLRSIGKKAFIECFYILKEEQDGENENIISCMMSRGGAKKESSARTKASIGRKIFKEGMELEALKNIISSNRVQEATKNKALVILQKEGEHS